MGDLSGEGIHTSFYNSEEEASAASTSAAAPLPGPWKSTAWHEQNVVE